MNNIHYLPKPTEQPENAPSHHQTPRWSAQRQRNAWLMLTIILLGTATVFALSNSPSSYPQAAPLHSAPTNVTQPTLSSTIATNTQQTTSSPITAIGNFREYPAPQADTELMRPAIDHAGRLWFGEMGLNTLAVFDPQTHTFQQMTAPRGRYGIMAVQVAPDDTIWFAEQYANYIGHYLPKTAQFQTYPLPWLTIPDPNNPGKTLSLPSAPNELAFDTHGNIWFTEFNADQLGRLDTHTGLMQHYPLAAKTSVQTLYPYGITIDAQGMVWFTEASNNQVGRLDPATGSILSFTMPGTAIQLMEIASAADGTIWATSFTPGLLLRLDPRANSFTSYYTPFTGSDKSGLYGLIVTPAGEVWITIPAENAIARLDSAANRFIYYHSPTKGSSPLGVVMGANHTLWFTGVDKVGALQV